MSIVCNICSSQLKDKKMLKKHQTTARKCLEKQKELSKMKCIVCSISCLCQEELEIHQFNCVSTLRNENIELKEQNSILKNQILEQRAQIEILQRDVDKYHKSLEEIAKAPRITTNTTNNNNNQKIMNLSVFNYNKEQLEHIIETEFVEKHFKDGIVGCAKFVFSNLILDDKQLSKMVCPNFKTMEFKYRNSKNEIVSDIHARDLSEKLFDCKLYEKSTKICESLISKEPKKKDRWMNTNYEISTIRNNPIKLAKELRVLLRNDSDKLKEESKQKYLALQKEEAERLEGEAYELEEEAEERAQFELKCDEEHYDADSDIVLSDDESIEIAIEKSDARKRIRMGVRNYNEKLKIKFDKIRNFNEERDAEAVKKYARDYGEDWQFTINVKNEFEEIKKFYAEYRNGTLDLNRLL